MLNPYFSNSTGTLYHGDALETLRRLPDESVQCCVTSPPYWGLRDYGVAGQIGLEDTPEAHVALLVDIFAEIHRVLKNDGTLWVNYGDTYLRQQGQGFNANHKLDKASRSIKLKSPLPPKNLLGMPWRLAFALQQFGWYLRCDIIWHKSNAMPESVKDRPARAHEYIFLLSKSEKYFYDHAAIKEPAGYQPPGQPPHNGGRYAKSGNKKRKPGALRGCPSDTGANVCGSVPWQGFMRNKRSVWTVNIAPFTGAHFATFPPKLIEPCILAGTRPGDIVLDPFMGSGTTGMVARKHGRKWLGIELNQEYCDMALKRIGVHAPYLWETEQPGAPGEKVLHGS